VSEVEDPACQHQPVLGSKHALLDAHVEAEADDETREDGKGNGDGHEPQGEALRHDGLVHRRGEVLGRRHDDG
jgi:hypothetical protein